MPNTPRCPEDSGHIHEERFIPGVPGVIPPPPTPPDGGDAPPASSRRKNKTETSEGADQAPSVVKEA